MTDHNKALECAFNARARHKWSEKPVPTELIHRLYDFVKLGPTSMNCSPARFFFLLSQEARDRAAVHAKGTNQPKMSTAPCVVIIATDGAFYEEMPKLFPIREGAREMFVADKEWAQSTAFRNATLQGAYLLIAARLLGLDCGPMSGFDHAGIDAEFFAGTALKSNFLCCLGYANDEPFPRLPRLTFDEAAKIL